MSRLIAAAVAAYLGLAGGAQALVVTLDFEGLQDLEEVLGFYDGGAGSLGSSGGTDFGVEFEPGAVAIIDSDAGGSGNFGGEPTPDTILFFPSGSSAVMNVADGFESGFSFFYAAPDEPGVVEVYDWDTQEVLQRIESGEGSFLRGVVRSLVRQRHGLESAIAPFELSLLADRRLIIGDPETGEDIDLNAFGPTNLAVFAAFIGPAPETTVTQR